MTWDAILLSYRRPGNLPALVAALRAQSPAPRAVLVWHNGPESGREPFGDLDFYATANCRCRARHAVGLLSEADACVFVDDDVLPAPGFVAPMLAGIEAHPESVVGPEARRCLSVGPEMYWGTQSARFAHRDGPVSVVKGKIHACRRDVLHWAFVVPLPPAVATEDDIVLCASASGASDQPAWCVTGMRGLYKSLADDCGNEKRPEHFDLRNRACLHLAALGWNPLLWNR